MPSALEMRVVQRQRVELAEEMLSINALAERWHCHRRSVERAIQRHRDTAGKFGLASVGAGRRLRVPARAANRYAASDDFLRS